MTDQCKGCEAGGDLRTCKALDCFHHDNWYAIEQQKIIDNMAMLMRMLLSERQASRQAKKYLAENGLMGSPLRDIE